MTHYLDQYDKGLLRKFARTQITNEEDRLMTHYLDQYDKGLLRKFARTQITNELMSTKKFKKLPQLITKAEKEISSRLRQHFPEKEIKVLEKYSYTRTLTKIRVREPYPGVETIVTFKLNIVLPQSYHYFEYCHIDSDDYYLKDLFVLPTVKQVLDQSEKLLEAIKEKQCLFDQIIHKKRTLEALKKVWPEAENALVNVESNNQKGTCKKQPLVETAFEQKCPKCDKILALCVCEV